MGNPSAFLKKRGLKSEIILEGHNEDVSAKAYSNNKKTPT
jgi:hypothetical protein